MKRRTTNNSESKKQTGWLIVSGIAFLVTILASGVLVFFGKQLESIGIVGNVYYIVLIPLGLSSAAFLSGAMKSYASFTTNESFAYGKLRLAGPVVIFALVVGGGFIMPNLNKEKYFDIKFRIVGFDNSPELFNTGKLILYIGKEPKTANIHDGEAIFYNSPEIYSNKIVKVFPVIENYQVTDSSNILISRKSDYIDIRVVRTKESLVTNVRGSIINRDNAPVKNAFINFGSGLATGFTDQNGDFFFTVPLPEGEKVTLKVMVDDVIKFNENVTLSSTIPMNMKL
jgi:hypothetical protein